MSKIINNNNFIPTAQVSTYELWARPLREDWHLFLFFTLLFFVAQHGSKFVMNRISKKFRSLSEEDKATWSVRFVSCVNSIICGRAAFLFVTKAFQMESELDLYATIPGFRLNSIAIASYFIWDVIVCVIESWGVVYTVHGIASLLGTYLTTWPCAERWVGWFSGVFELSNIFVHGAEMLTMLDMAPGVVAAMKGIFAILFIVVRPFGGTYIGYKYSVAAFALINDDYRYCHHWIVPWAMMAVTWFLMILQYLWTKQVLIGIGAALGLCSAEGLGDAKSPTAKKEHKDFQQVMAEDLVAETRKTK